MPKTAKVVDWMRTEFPGIKVLYAEEGQYRIGNKPDPSKYVTPQSYVEPAKKARKK